MSWLVKQVKHGVSAIATGIANITRVVKQNLMERFGVIPRREQPRREQPRREQPRREVQQIRRRDGQRITDIIRYRVGEGTMKRNDFNRIWRTETENCPRGNTMRMILKYAENSFVSTCFMDPRDHPVPVFNNPANQYEGMDIVYSLEEILGDIGVAELVVEKKRGNQNIGSGPKNNCLADLIIKLAPSYLKTAPQNPKILKRKLGLRRNGPIPVELIPTLEDIYKIRINVEGEQKSQKPFKPFINIRIHNGHCFHVQSNADDDYISPKPFKKGEYRGFLTMYMEPKTKKLFIYNQQKGESKISSKKLIGLNTNMLIVRVKKREELAEKYVQIHDFQVYMFVNHGIDITQYRSLKHLSLALFQNLLCYDLKKCNVEEAEFIGESLMGGLCYSEKHIEKPDCVSLDVNSMYLNCMKSHKFPIAPGEIKYDGKIFNKLFEDKSFSNWSKLPYGLYTINISPSEIYKEKVKRYSYNTNMVYTHAECKDMAFKGYEFTFQDKYMMWRDDEIHSGIFKKFINMMWNAKQTASYSKLPANMLWGLLTERFKRLKKFNKDVECVLEDDIVYEELEKFDETSVTVKIRPQDEPSFIRCPYIGTFLTAFARQYLNKLLDEIDRKVYRVHTDGFITKRENMVKLEKKMGDELGELKLEKKGNLILIHVNKYSLN